MAGIARTLYRTAAVLLVACALLCGAAPAWADNTVDTGQLPDGSFLFEVSIADLLADSAYYDSQTVQIAGEVVGDRIGDETNGDACWITVSERDGNTTETVQVHISTSLTDSIDSYGRYGVTGSTVSIMGEFHAGCSSHEGLEDIHATTLTVVEQGGSDPDEFDWESMAVSALLIGIGLVVFIVYRRYRAASR